MSSRDRTILAVLVLLVIAVGGYFVFVKPEHAQANRLATEITAEQSALSTAEAQVRAGEVAEGEYRNYARQLKSIAAAVPSDAQIPQLINELQAAANKTRVSFQTVSTSSSSSTAPPTTPTTTTFPSQSFSLTFSGGYFAVTNLLGRLASFVHADDRAFHASGRLITISSVALSPGTASGAASTSHTGGAGDVTAAITALDYDIPSGLGSTSTSATGA